MPKILSDSLLVMGWGGNSVPTKLGRPSLEIGVSRLELSSKDFCLDSEKGEVLDEIFGQFCLKTKKLAKINPKLTP